jgi:hypothetical protein
MPYTKRQQKAACTAYGIKKQGGKPRVMAGMPQSKLRQWCKAKDLEKKEESVIPMFKFQQLQEVAPGIITKGTKAKFGVDREDELECPELECFMDLEQRLDERLNEAKFDYPIMMIQGQEYRVAGANEKGERDLLNMDSELVGKIMPDETIVMHGEKGQPLGVAHKGQKAEITGPGDEPEDSGGGERKPSTRPPSGWNITWINKDGVKTGKFFDTEVGLERAKRFLNALRKGGYNPEIKEVRMKSEFTPAGMVPGQVKPKKKKSKKKTPENKVPRRKRTQDPEQVKRAMELLGL